VLPPVIHLTVAMGKGPPGDSSQTVTLEGAVFDIAIVNDSLSVGTVYEVVFVPKGKEGAFADVYMEQLQ
jgi:hypothetical protein